jgi:hypothetical protein
MNTALVAELGAVAEAIGDYGRRVNALTNGVPAERDDLLAAIVEAERSLGIAERAVRRAIKVAAIG